MSIRETMLQTEIDELKRALNMQAGTMSQMMDMIRVELEDNDDPEKALKLVKEFSSE